MGLKICSFSSGSGGNCIFVASEQTNLLVDAGIPAKTIGRSLRALGVATENLSVLVTHSHGDHVGYLASFEKASGARVYSHSLARCEVQKRGDFALSEFDSAPFTVGDISVTPFRVPHDVPCVGFTLRNGNRAISILTDLGEAGAGVVGNLMDSDILFIESNHDEGLVKSGKYPPHLKRRILSGQGHLSNSACAAVCEETAVKGRVRQIILGHLSKDNNSPELAFHTVVNRLAFAGIFEGKDVSVEVAPSSAPSGLFLVS